MDYAIYKATEGGSPIAVSTIQEKTPNNAYGAVVIYVKK
jgi:hypothetical protein